MRKLFVVLAALALPTGAFAQWGFFDTLDWGVKGGLNVSHLTNSDMIGMTDSKAKASFYLGVFAEFDLLSDWLTIQPEIVYSRQGNFYKHEGVKTWNRANYLNIPVMFKFYVLDQLSVDVGPQFGFLLNAKTKEKANSHTETHSMSSEYKDFDFSFGLGATYYFNRFEVSARYNIGLTKAATNPTDGEKMKNGVLQIGAGYRF